MSASIEVPAVSDFTCGTSSSEKKRAAAAKVRASTAIAQPGLTAATRMPPKENPTIWADVWQMRRTDTAAGSSSAGTVSRVIACDDGPLSADRQPTTTPNTVRLGIVAQPLIRLTA